MKEDDKNIEQAFDAFQKFVKINMIEIQFNWCIKEWAEEIAESFRNQVITIPDYIGKSADTICQLNPTLEMYITKEKSSEIAVIWETEEVEMFIFKKNICTDAYQIPNDKIGEVMSKELREKLFLLSDSVKEFYKY